LTLTKTFIFSGSISTDLRIFTSKEGRNLIQKIDSLAEKEEITISSSYLALGKYFYQTLFENSSSDETYKTLGLNRYNLQNGKTLWLCEDHVKQTGAQIVDMEKNVSSSSKIEEINLLLEEIHILESTKIVVSDSIH
jgi:hypothetical protein